MSIHSFLQCPPAMANPRPDDGLSSAVVQNETAEPLFILLHVCSYCQSILDVERVTASDAGTSHGMCQLCFDAAIRRYKGDAA